MSPPRRSTPSRTAAAGIRVATLAAEQRGVVARRQLERLGVGNATIAAWSQRGILQRVWPGVYTHGHSVLTRDGWLMAAVLACGDGALLAARASAGARGLLRAWSTIEVVTPDHMGVQLAGIRAIRAEVRPEERDVHRGLPVTSLARTALDLAAREGEERVGELLDRALLDGQYDHAEMRALLDARRGCRGVARLRRAVALLGDDGVVFRSRPERLARDLLRRAELPEPSVNAWFPTRAGHGHELDLWWPALRLDLEVDGPHHALPRQRRRDARRDADLRSFGVSVVRVSVDEVVQWPERVAARMAHLLAEHPTADPTPDR